jgi:tRNA dimethylallyltransferase
LDIGSGKIKKSEMGGIKHHLLDVANPRSVFSVTRYRKLALAAIKRILKEGDIPIICGGTGFYIQAVVDGIVIPEVKPNWALRKKLEKLSTEKLFLMLQKLDPHRAQNIESKNPRRLIRAIEIVKTTKNPVPEITKDPLPYDTLFIGVKIDKNKLKRLIAIRTGKRLKSGMVAETRRLRKNGLSWKKLENFGLEYRACAQFLQKKITAPEMAERIKREDEQYAKRQMTWFSRDTRINWLTPKIALSRAKKFAKNN